MNLPAHVVRRLRKFLADVDVSVYVSQIGPYQESARWLLERLKERPRRKVLGLKSRLTVIDDPIGPADKKASRREEMAELRRKVFERALCGFGSLSYPHCELCLDGRDTVATDLDHLVSGSGNRHAHQSKETCVAVCYMCHRERTSNPESKYAAIVAWAARHGYAVPKQIEDRHQKYLRLHPEAAK